MTRPSSSNRRSATWSALALATLLALSLAFGAFSHAEARSSAGSLSTITNAGVFVGTHDGGNFQLALEDAIQQAGEAAGCCDFRITYEVLSTTGQSGGFVLLNDIFVKIHATW